MNGHAAQRLSCSDHAMQRTSMNTSPGMIILLAVKAFASCMTGCPLGLPVAACVQLLSCNLASSQAVTCLCGALSAHVLTWHLSTCPDHDKFKISASGRCQCCKHCYVASFFFFYHDTLGSWLNYCMDYASDFFFVSGQPQEPHRLQRRSDHHSRHLLQLAVCGH